MSRIRLSHLLSALFVAGLSAPAHAAGSVPLPEPSMLTLLSLGAAGVLVGRRLSAKRPRQD